ncbi:MAG: transposase [Mangrovicoccus sp.]
MASRPTEKFRSEAVRVALTSGLPCKQTAADFEIGFSTLNRWIQQDRRNPEKPSVQSDLEREIAELRKENRMLRDLQGSVNSPGDCFPAARGMF